MKKLRATLALALVSALIIVAVPIYGAKGKPDPPETLIWAADVWSTGVPVTSPVLELGREYRIVAKGSFISCDPTFGWVVFAADPQYYTMEFLGSFPSNWWLWTSPIRASPSFLQIDGMDVDWGPFSNGGATWSEGHEYTISYMGSGVPITFTVVDWIDEEYLWNFSHFYIRIYEGPLVKVGETAFAYGGDYATCFLCMDLDMDGKRDFKNWGWSNGPLGPGHYEFDIWAGAAKCNLNKGTLVGTLIIDYDGMTGTATVTYMMDAGWTMGFAQLYVDGEILPRDSKDEFTVAPGQYPYIHYVDGPTHTFPVSGLSGDIYVVAHADVFEV